MRNPIAIHQSRILLGRSSASKVSSSNLYYLIFSLTSHLEDLCFNSNWVPMTV